ncbi:MAG: hypothetical protein M5U26_27185 [Planctomycetota bacterium]|nr:hypothetical protein [Planctomycetota bacterium]
MPKRGRWTSIGMIRRTVVGLGLAASLHVGSAFGATFEIADGDVTGLVSAIATANANGEADTINLAPAGTYTLTASNNTSSGDNGLPAIAADGGNPLRINGRGATITRSGAAPDFRILLISGGNLTLQNTTIANGRSSSNYNGGGIRANGTLILNNCTITGNTAVGGFAYGGGLDVRFGQTATVNNSTFTGNAAEGGGGAINVYGTLNLRNSTITGNSAPNGGGIYTFGDATLLNSTVAGNSTAGDGGGVQVSGGTLAIQNTIVSDNTAGGSGPDISGSVNSDFSLIEDPSGATLTGSNNITLQDPNLGALQDNGGPTQTMLPGAGPAIDAGDNTLAAGLLVDQRLLGRVANGTVDMGAVESGAAALTNLIVDNAADEDDGDFGPGDFSLREAVGLANFNGGANAIGFDPALTAGGDATLNLSSVGDTNAGPSALGVTSDITITGPAADNGITVARDGAAGDMRLFYVDAGSSLTLQNLTLSNGRAVGGNGGGFGTQNTDSGGGGAGGLGGAVFNAGTLSLVQSTLSGNQALGGDGGDGGRRTPNGATYYYYAGGGGGGFGGNGGAASDGGGGGGGTASAGGNASGGTGGAAGTANGGGGGSFDGGAGGAGGFGGGGGGGATSFTASGAGGASSFGGGGGGGGSGLGTNGGAGGAGGFGAGGGGGGGSYVGAGAGGASGFGGGAGGAGGAGAGPGGGGGGGGAGLGGGIFNYGGTLTVTNSTISGNTAQGGTGGGANNNGGLGVDGGDGAGLGGGVFNRNGTVTLTNATIANNTADDGGGGLFNVGDGAAGTVTLNNSIVADSANAATDLETATINAGTDSLTGNNNLIEDPTGHPFIDGTNGNLVGVDPALNALADNGGPAFTHLPVEGSSPVIDAIAAGQAVDQRGIARPQGSNFDIGAVEVENPILPGSGYLPTYLRLTSNWRTPNRDRAVLIALMDNPDAAPAPGVPYPFDGTAVTIDIGEQVFAFTLNARGRDTLTNGRNLIVRYLRRTNQLRVILRSPFGAYQGQWLDDGLMNVQAQGTPVTAPTSIQIGTTLVSGDVPLRWFNRANFSGNATGKGLVLPP